MQTHILSDGEDVGRGESQPHVGNPKPLRFQVDGVKEGFMLNLDNAKKLLKLIDEISKLRATQECVDKFYDEFVQVFHQEMASL